MDIAVLGKNSIKIKGKQVTFVVDPTKETPKTSADAIILLDGSNDIDISRITDSRIIINGPGGYEVGGAKISGTKTPRGTIYRFSIDDVSIVLGYATDAKIEGFNMCQVVVVNTSSDFSDAFVTAIEPKITVLYGDKKLEGAKALGAENVVPVPKVTISRDKLPEKMEIVVLE